VLLLSCLWSFCAWSHLGASVSHSDGPFFLLGSVCVCACVCVCFVMNALISNTIYQIQSPDIFLCYDPV
jgi:hypothetical protein